MVISISVNGKLTDEMFIYDGYYQSWNSTPTECTGVIIGEVWNLKIIHPRVRRVLKTANIHPCESAPVLFKMPNKIRMFQYK